MTSTVNLEPMFLNPIDAALHASIELGRIQAGRNCNLERLQSILEALTDEALQTSGAMYGMTPLASRDAYSHVAAIDETLVKIGNLFGTFERQSDRISGDALATLKEYCEFVHDHYQAARWIEERTAIAR